MAPALKAGWEAAGEPEGVTAEGAEEPVAAALVGTRGVEVGALGTTTGVVGTTVEEELLKSIRREYQMVKLVTYHLLH
jgi:hypothetical protein